MLFSIKKKEPLSSSALILRTFPDSKSFENLLPSNYKRRRAPRTRKGRFIKWSAVGLIAVILGFALSMSGGVGATSTSTANAWNPFSSFCGYSNANDPVIPEGTSSDLLSVAGATQPVVSSTANPATSTVGLTSTRDPYADWTGVKSSLFSTAKPLEPITAYQWFGTSGQSWTNYNYQDYTAVGVSCLNIVGTVGNLVANVIFLIDRTAAGFAATLYGWIMSRDAFTPFLHTINTFFVGNGGSNTGLINTLFLKYLTPIVLAGALLMGWQGLVKKRSSQAIQSAIWMLGSASVSLVFLLHPIGIATLVDNGVGAVSYGIIDSITSANSTGEGDLCYSNQSWRTAECDIWQVFIYSPWSSGQFGNLGSSELTSATSKTVQNGVTLPGNPVAFRSVGMLYLDAYAVNHDDSLLSVGASTTPSSPLVSSSQRLEIQQALHDKMLAAQSTDPGSVAIFAGSQGSWIHRIGLAFMDFLAMGLAVVPILILSFNIILLQLGLVIIMLMAPFFLTIGVYPGFGRRMTMTWFEMLISNCLKRVGNAFVLGLLLFMLETIVTMGGAWPVQIVFMIAATLGIIGARTKIVKAMSSVRLGGEVFSSDQIDSGLRQGMHRLRRGAVTTIKDGMAFEGGFTKGARSSLIGRNKYTGQLVAAGKDIKAATDPLNPLKKEIAKAKATDQKNWANQNLLDATGSDDKSMEQWRKWHRQTGNPVPYPKNEAQRKFLDDNNIPYEAGRYTWNNGKLVQEIPGQNDASETSINGEPNNIANGNGGAILPVDKSLETNGSGYPTLESIPTEQASHFTERRQALESALEAEKLELISTQHNLKNLIAITEQNILTNQNILSDATDLTDLQKTNATISLDINKQAREQYVRDNENIEKRFIEMAQERNDWIILEEGFKQLREKLKPRSIFSDTQTQEIPMNIPEVPIPSRLDKRVQDSDKIVE